MKKIILLLLFVYSQSEMICNSAIDCELKGEMYLDKANYKKAKYYFEQACTFNLKEGCYSIGIMYIGGYIKNADIKEAEYYLKKSCDLNMPQGCFNTGLLYLKGFGVKKDYSIAKFYFKKGCDLGLHQCCANYQALEKHGY